MAGFLSWLFGGRETSATAPAQTYKDFSIRPVAQRESGGWRLAAEIEKEGRKHLLIRSDVLQSQEAADSAAFAKAKQVIDEQGSKLFD